MSYPPSAQTAIDHLKTNFPYASFSLGTWVSKEGEKLLVIKKKGISVCRKGYKHIYLLSATSSVLGSDTEPFASSGDVLVDAKGNIPDTRSPTLARYSTSSSSPASTSSVQSDYRRLSVDLTNAINTNLGTSITPTSLPFAILILLISISYSYKLLTTILRFSFLLIPVYLTLSNTVPPSSTFEPKKMLKRVLRKEDLPPDHPEKPKGWLSSIANRAMASVAGEALTALGYTVTMKSILGCFKVANVRLDSNGVNV
eukprot:CAMPEP_0118656830 /NCGR_PEP_ID=MMETSP0785-20121206/13690_1 /TAXON_ID=91992 /ORGANISM="Bolidomonas pacifica, Strain CCMP 1866" /LENGTH=255 /DNA_ID=CAMNT_0006549699 /DNA_START=171 /DNA_END=934 /DNA_ORIENTATION=+